MKLLKKRKKIYIYIEFEDRWRMVDIVDFLYDTCHMNLGWRMVEMPMSNFETSMEPSTVRRKNGHRCPMTPRLSVPPPVTECLIYAT